MTDFNYRATLDNILKNVSLGIRPSTLWKSYTPHSRPASPLPTEILEESQDDYPQVKFWHKADWSKHQEVEKSKPTDPTSEDGRNDTMAMYIEDRCGVPVSNATLKEIRKTMRCVWNLFEDSGEAPPQWGKASSKVVNAYRSELRQAHPELRLCANDWKSEMLAMQGYPSWYQNHIKPIKREEVPPSKKQTKRWSDVDEDNSTGEQNMVVVKKHRVKN